MTDREILQFALASKSIPTAIESCRYGDMQVQVSGLYSTSGLWRLLQLWEVPMYLQTIANVVHLSPYPVLGLQDLRAFAAAITRLPHEYPWQLFFGSFQSPQNEIDELLSSGAVYYGICSNSYKIKQPKLELCLTIEIDEDNEDMCCLGLCLDADDGNLYKFGLREAIAISPKFPSQRFS